MSNITELKPNQIFVFGSNLNGHHAGGAARQAKESFGAIEGQGIGLQGQSYAIPTLGYEMEQLSLPAIQSYLYVLSQEAKENPDMEYLLTPIGTGIARYTVEDIKSILPTRSLAKNITLVGEWE